WQSCPPLLTGVLLRISEARHRSVAGTHTSAATSVSSPFMNPLPMAASSPSEAPVPFIFQLPATSRRIPGVIGFVPSFDRKAWLSYQKQGTKQSTPAGKDGMPVAAPSARGSGQPEDVMLNSLRNAANSWVAKLLLVVLVLSFAVWGISGQIFGGLGSNVVTVC